MAADHRTLVERGLKNAAVAGDESAWEMLYTESFDQLYAYVHCRTARAADLTEEVLQETWLVAVRRIRAFDPDRGPFECWLRGIADNVLRAARRQAARRQALERAATPEERTSAPTGAGSELGERMALALTALPAHYQAVLLAKYEEGLAVAEIARRWGESAKAVESLLARARAAFRSLFAAT
jgi:RNA polymerase sigma-70 factor (ECF subfamily)